jgi:hypothetical protein
LTGGFKAPYLLGGSFSERQEFIGNKIWSSLDCSVVFKEFPNGRNERGLRNTLTWQRETAYYGKSKISLESSWVFNYIRRKELFWNTPKCWRICWSTFTFWEALFEISRLETVRILRSSTQKPQIIVRK